MTPNVIVQGGGASAPIPCNGGLEMIDVTGKKHDPALSEEDVKAIFAAGDRGDEAEMRRIVESRGLIWHGALVEKSHLQQLHELEILP